MEARYPLCVSGVGVFFVPAMSLMFDGTQRVQNLAQELSGKRF